MGASDSGNGHDGGGPLPSLGETLRRLESQGVERLDASEEVARGGMGMILKARDPALERDVAMKVILGDDGVSSKAATLSGDDEETDALRRAVARFVVEAQVTARLDHPGVVPVHRLGLDDKGRVFFTMRLVKGRSLDRILPLVAAGHEGWTLTKAIQVFLKVCDTLAYAHSKGVIHRDVKPANLMVGAYGEVYVMDWGLAKIRGNDALGEPSSNGGVGARGGGEPPVPPSGDDLDATLTYAGAIVGTPTYMPPEQARGGAADAKTDVYAVGAMLYELLAGSPPYAKESSEGGVARALKAMIDGPPMPLSIAAPNAPVDLVAIAEKAMERDPAKRYASAKDLGHDLQNWLEGRVVMASRHGPLVELRKWIGRNRGTAAAIAAAVVVAIAGAVAFAVQEKQAADDIAQSLSRETAARTEAEANQRRADGLRAATLAVSLAPKDPALALRLGLMSHERTPGRFANAALAEALLRHRELRCLRGHDAYVETACWSPSGMRIASVGSGQRAIVWDAEAGVALHRVKAGVGPPYLVAFLDDRRFVVRTDEREVTVYDAETGAPLLPIDARAPVASLASDASGGRVLVGTKDGAVLAFSATDGREIARFAAGQGPVAQVSDAGNGLVLATIEGERTRVWRAADASLVGSYPAAREARAGEPAEALATKSYLGTVSPDGRHVATTGGGDVAIWETATGTCVGWWRVGPSAWCAFSADGRRASLSGGDGPWVLFDLVGRRVARTSANGIRATAWTADGAIVAGERTATEVDVHDATSGRSLGTFKGHTYGIKRCAFSPDGKRLLTASADMSIRVWDASFSDLALAPDRAVVTGRRITNPDPTGRHVLSWDVEDGKPAGRCDVVDMATGRVVSTLDADWTGGLAWSPDGKALVATDREGESLQYVDAGSGKRLWTAPGRGLHGPLFSPDGKRIAARRMVEGSAGHGEVAVYDAASGREVAALLRDLPAILNQGAWSPDARRIAVGGDYGITRIVDVHTGAVAAISGHSGMVISAKFSSDGRTVYTTAVDTSVRAWDSETGQQRWLCLGFPMRALSLHVSPDGRLLLLEGGYVIDAEKGELIVDLSTSPDAGWTARGFSPEGRLWLTSTDERVRREFPTDLVAAARAAEPRMPMPVEEERLGLAKPEEMPARERAWAERWRSGRTWKAVGDRTLAAGDVDAAETAYRRVLELSEEYGWGHFGLAQVAARRLGSLPAAKRDAAIAEILTLLERSRDSDYPAWDRLAKDPDFAPLRSLPRFQALESRSSRNR